MKIFSPPIFIISAVSIETLAFASFIAAMALRGDDNDPFFVSLFAALFPFFLFPAHTLFNFGVTVGIIFIGWDYLLIAFHLGY
jgi:hypothetical protein